jgi:hypothetical protein
MPVDITDVSIFTDPITAPAGADTADAASVVAPVQKLSNRTRYLLNRIDGYGGLIRTSDALSGLSVDVTPVLLDKFDADLGSDGERVISQLADSQIEIGASGPYEVHASISFQTVSAEEITVSLYVNGSFLLLKAREETAGSEQHSLGLSGLIDVDAGDLLELRVAATNAGTFHLRGGSTFWIRRV